MAPVILLIFIVVMLLVRINLGSPIFFTQERPGLHAKPFVMVKFRSMTEACDELGQPLPDNARITKFGSLLRSSSLDELPELWNVLKGDMSLVGPRPLLMEYLPLYSSEQQQRHSVRPGITGLAQVNGRNAITWLEKFDLDIFYVRNQSLWLDLKILVLTIKNVLLQRDINPDGWRAVEKFKGR